MNRWNILKAVFIGFTLYSLLVLEGGTYGISALSELKSFKEKQIENISNLKQKNNILRNDLDSLKSNVTELELKARRVGYFRQGEKVVFIEGIKQQSRKLNPGQTLYFKQKFADRDRVFRAIGFIVAVFSLFLFIVSDKLRGIKNDI